MIRNLMYCAWVVALLVSLSTAGQWIGFGQSNDFNEDGGVSYVIGHDGKIFLVGYDLVAGGQPINNIGVWDGIRWRDTTTGIPRNSIQSILIDKDGQLIVCAALKSDSNKYGEYRNWLMRWDGVKWNPLGGGLEGAIAMTIDSAGTIYACAKLYDEFPIRNVTVKYNGNSWDTIGEYLDCRYGKIIFDHQGTLWTCGSFDYVGEVPAAGVARWDGNNWEPMSTGLVPPGTGNKKVDVQKLLSCKETIYAMGEFYTIAPGNVCGLAKWDGTSWQSVGDLLFTSVNSIDADSLGNLYVSGSIKDSQDSTHWIVAMWNGTQWKQLGEMDEGMGILIVDHSGKVYGYSSVCSGLSVWRDNKWIPAAIEIGLNGQVSSIFVDSIRGYVYVGGDFNAAGGTVLHGVARWDGQKWESFGRDSYHSVTAITGNTKGEIVISTWAKSSQVLVRFSDGIWDTIGQFNVPGRCYALAYDVTDTLLYAGGSFDSIGGIAARNIVCWDGTSWKALGTGISGDYVEAIVADRNCNIYAGGSFERAGYTVAHNIAKWDGTSWQSLSKGIRKDPSSFHPVSALAIDDGGNLYAGGEFSEAGFVAANNIARWDGARWNSLAEGITSNFNGVSALALNPAGILFAGGSIYSAGNVSVNGIAQWNGQQWSSLDEGVQGSVYALFCDNTTLHVGGIFNRAGKYTSFNFAQYRFGETKSRTLHIDIKTLSTVSFDKRNMALLFHLKMNTSVQIDITNLMGKVVRSTHAKLSRGDHHVPITTNALPCGVYVARVRAGSNMSAFRFIMER